MHISLSVSTLAALLAGFTLAPAPVASPPRAAEPLPGAARAEVPPRLTPGRWLSDRLSTADAHRDGHAVDPWTFSGEANQVVRIWMSSSEFDTRFRLGHYHGDGEYHELASDDDGGEGTNSYLQFTLPQAGSYVLDASSYRTASYGAYSVFLELRGGAPEGRTVVPGNTYGGTLNDGSRRQEGRRYQDWSYRGASSGPVEVSLQSDDFDPYLQIGVLENGSFVALLSDDDGGEGTDAFLTFTPVHGRRYVIRARGYSADDRGDYLLRID